MLGPALTHGVAGPAVSQSATGDPSTAFNASTPSLVQSATLGFMDPRIGHNRGLRSGGLVGYSTFFTGYDPERDGLARQLSLGRGAAQAVSTSARALMHTGLQDTQAARYIEPFTMAHKYGIGGAASAARSSAFAEANDVVGATTTGTGSSVGRSQRLSFARRTSIGDGPGQGIQGRSSAKAPYAPTSKAQMGRGRLQLRGRTDIDGLARGGRTRVRNALSSSNPKISAADDVADATEDAAQAFRRNKTGGGFFRALTGMLGGKGYDRRGNFSGNVARETIGENEYLFRSASKSSGGATLIKGTAGKAIGKGFKTLGYVELANMAVDAATYAAGQGYESLVQTTERMQRRVGADKSMSGGYFNRAAATERQRAVQSLNANRLNPRTQIMGNEAYMSHK